MLAQPVALNPSSGIGVQLNDSLTGGAGAGTQGNPAVWEAP